MLAKSVTPSRIEENKNVIQLDATDMAILDKYSNELKANGKLKRYVYPEFGVDFGFPDKS